MYHGVANASTNSAPSVAQKLIAHNSTQPPRRLAQMSVSTALVSVLPPMALLPINANQFQFIRMFLAQHSCIFEKKANLTCRNAFCRSLLSDGSDTLELDYPGSSNLLDTKNGDFNDKINSYLCFKADPVEAEDDEDEDDDSSDSSDD